MALELSDIKFLKSMTVTDTDINGGRMNEQAEVVSGQKYNLFPRVSYDERTNGYTRYRKEFMANRNGDDEIAYGALICEIKPSNGGDRFYLKAGIQEDTQADLTGDGWTGGGKLYADVAAGAAEIQVEFEEDDFYIPNDKILCVKDDTNIAWLKTVAGIIDDEQIGAGNGTTTPTLNNIGNTPIRGNTVTIATLDTGDNPMSVTDDGSGNLSGDGSGTINYTTGAVSITWGASTKSGEPILADYIYECDSWSGNVATIKLADQVPYNFDDADTYVGVCLELGDLQPAKADVVATSTNGTFDENELTLGNQGAVEDDWTITFTSATAFTCSGVSEGGLANGTINTEYAPINPRTNQPFFTIATAAWGGTWETGDTVTFTTHPASAAIWWKEVIPAGTDREAQNEVEAEWFVE